MPVGVWSCGSHDGMTLGTLKPFFSIGSVLHLVLIDLWSTGTSSA